MVIFNSYVSLPEGNTHHRFTVKQLFHQQNSEQRLTLCFFSPWIYFCTYLLLGKFHHDLTVLPHWNHGECIGKSSPFMALIQVSDIL